MRKVLVADDEMIERKGIASLLMFEDYDLEILEAANGKEALELVKQKKPDILISDIKMPFMNGLELMDEVRKFCPDMGIIVITGYSDFSYAHTAIKNGVVGYVLKPVDPDEFHQIFDKAMTAISEKEQNEMLIHKNQDFLAQYFLQRYINTGTREGLENASEIVDISWWKCVGRMVLLETNVNCFDKEDVDFETLLADELQIPFYYLNIRATCSLLLFDRDQKIDYFVLAKHIHEFTQRLWAGEALSYVAVSSPLGEEMTIPQGFQELELLMENRYYRSKERIFMPDSNWQERDNYDFTVEMLQKMREDIQLHDINHLWEHYHKFAEQKELNARSSYIFVKFSCANLVGDMYKEMNYTLNKFEKIVDKMYYSKSIQEVVDVLEQTISVYEETMFSDKSSARGEVERVKSYIYSHYQEELSVEILGNAVYLSPGYLSYIFKQETGEGLSHFIRRFRLEKAKEQLSNTNKKIIQICQETGFTNSSYFCKSFREYYGCSPEQFRKKI